MSAMALDQSLDTIIKANRKSKRGPRAAKPAEKKKVSSISKTKKAAITGRKKPAAVPAATLVAKPQTSAATSNKINITNLPLDVKEPEIRELFSKTVGPLREVHLHYDAKGQSKGMGSVTFSKREDAAKAVQMYHNRLIDGSRQMKVELVLQPGQAPTPPTLADRVAPAPAKAAANAKKSPATTTTAAKKKIAVKRKLRKPIVKKAPVTAADLDAQMEDYTAAAAK